MKAISILTIIAASFAAKVASECWSEEYGYPCCQETKDVVKTDEAGAWGIENGEWCGISKIESDAEDVIESGSDSDNDDELLDTSDVAEIVEPTESTVPEVPEVPGIPENPFGESPFPGGAGEEIQWNANANYTPAEIPNTAVSEYMSKLVVKDYCPADVSSPQEGVEYPTAEKITYYSNTTANERKMNVILPVGYTESKKYPVLYFLHGIMGDEDTMLLTGPDTIAIPTNLINSGLAKEMIIVLPNQYAPAPGTEIPPALTQEYFDGYDNFINELVNDIMPYIESNYSVATGRENTAVAGFSMGGRNSLYIGYKRSDLFGYVGAFSPAPGVVPGDDFSGHHPGLFKVESEFRTDYPPIVTLISGGTKDSIVGVFPKSYHDILTTNEQDHIWVEVPEADHDGTALDSGYYNFIQTAFGALDN
nr:feruloyl esterase [Pecoramyces sp. F1]